MLGYVMYKVDDCLLSDRVKYIKEFKDEVQIFGEFSTYFINEKSCIMLRDGDEIELGWFHHEHSKSKAVYIRGVGRNDFIKSN